MSTRATIAVESKQDKEFFRIYHHHDGYPQGVGADLVKQMDKLYADRKFWYAEEIVNHLIKLPNDEYEITSCVHGDEEYFYIIDVDHQKVLCQNCYGEEIDLYALTQED